MGHPGEVPCRGCQAAERLGALVVVELTDPGVEGLACEGIGGGRFANGGASQGYCDSRVRSRKG